MKLNPQATEYLYVRYVVGSANDTVSTIAVDSAGNVYVAGVKAPGSPSPGSRCQDLRCGWQARRICRSPIHLERAHDSEPRTKSAADAYLDAVDFSQPQPPAGRPQMGCIMDAANLAPAGPVVPCQLLTIFGTGLGPANAATATNYSTTTLGGVSVSFGSGFGAAAVRFIEPDQPGRAAGL